MILKEQLANFSGDLYALLPEIAVLATLLLLLAFDLIFKNRKALGLAGISFCGLLATVALLLFYGFNYSEGRMLVNGLLRFDLMGVFLKILFACGGLLGLLIASQGKDKTLFRSGESMVLFMGLILGTFLMSAAHRADSREKRSRGLSQIPALRSCCFGSDALWH